MKMGAKFLFSGVAALAVSAVIGWIAAGVLRELQTEFQRIERLTEITDKTQALNVLTGSFKEASLQSDLRQAKAALGSLGRLLDMSSRAVREQVLIEQLRKSQEELGPLIEQWFESKRTGDSLDRREMLASQIRTQVQFISDDTRRLRDISQARVLKAQRKAGGIIVVLMAVLALTNGAIYLFSARSMLRSQEALRESQEQFRLLFEKAPLGIARIDSTTGRFLLINAKYCDILQRTETEALQLDFQRVTHPDDLAQDLEHMRRLREGLCRSFQMDKRYLRPDGSTVWVTLTVVPEWAEGEPASAHIAIVADVTDRKRAEEALRKSEARWNAAIEGFAEGAIIATEAEEVIYWNPAARAMHGFRTPEEGIHPLADTPKTFELRTPDGGHLLSLDEWPMKRIKRGERVHNLELRLRRPDQGWERFVSYSGTMLETAGERLIFLSVHDLTEQRKAEQALRKSQERQGYLLKLGDALRPLKDPAEIEEAAARVLAESLNAERVAYFEVRGPDYVVERDYARSVPQLRGRFPITAFGPKLWDAYQTGTTVVVKDVETDASLSEEERLAYVAIQIGAHVGVPLVKGGRLVAGLAAHAKERREWTAEEVELIEETAERTWAAVGRARAEEALRQSEENYRTLFTSIDEGFCVIEMLFDHQGKPNDWRFVEVNPAFERHTGLLTPAGKRIRELTPDIESKWFEIYGKVAVTGEPIRFVEHSGPVNRWFDLYAFQVGDRKEHKVAVLFTDVTDRKRVEAELAKHREELERLVEERTAKLQELVGELEHFSYTITHDLKSPLRAMRGFAEIADTFCERREAKEFLGRIAISAERMDRLIADALNYSRTVRQELPLEDVDSGALLRGMLDSYPELQPAKAQIQVKGQLPVVLANEAGLTQVFSNLLGNAVKFVRPGEKPEILVWAEMRDGWGRIWVEDKGIGVSKDMLPRIFQMFSRGSKDYEGTGIGLALVRKVVQRMGGKVGVQSEEGKGSRFWVEVKLGEAEARGAARAPAARANGGEGTVLYVEDEEGDAMFMARAFEQRGLAGSLQVVGDGRAAIEYLSGSGKYGEREKHPVPVLVLLDLNLPQVSGFGVLEWMRNTPDYARLPVVVFSSSTRADDRLRAEELGANEFVAKPSSGLEFGKVVEGLQENWLRRRGT